MEPTERESSYLSKNKSVKSRARKKKATTKKKYRKYDNMTRETFKKQYDSYIKDIDREDNELEYNNLSTLVLIDIPCISKLSIIDNSN